MYDCDNEHHDTNNCDDTIDTRSGKERADQFKQTFEDAADKGDDECHNEHEAEQDDKEFFHGVFDFVSLLFKVCYTCII